uniref:Uncharacterized protein n=1 Tax=candidate division WOR-3 bacterium TaxID=2052148 RepID=A0A7C6AFU4_UNCW3
MKKKIKGSFLFIIGYLLSPLSWWNDLIINLPIAYIFAFPFGLISERLFLPMMIFGYWMTNALGFFLIHHSVKQFIDKEDKKQNGLAKNLLISFLYTILVLLLAKFGVLKFPLNYFK